MGVVPALPPTCYDCAPRFRSCCLPVGAARVAQGRDLCSKLSSVASVIKTPPAQLQSQLAIEVVSPILANSQNPLSVAREPL